MAMTPNLTLVVQMVHFLFAYALLTKFLLKPGYEAIKSDENRLHQLRSLISGEKEKLAEKQEYKKKRWQLCQNYFYQNRPDLEAEQQGLRSLKSLEQIVPLTQEELLAKSQEISDKLKSKVLQ